jgi:hypothetical protein
MYPGRFYMPFSGFNGHIPLRYGNSFLNGKGFVNLLNKIKNFNWGKLLSGANKTINVVNQTIPIIREVRPVANNIRNMVKLTKAFKGETTSKRFVKDKVFSNDKLNNNLPTFFV